MSRLNIKAIVISVALTASVMLAYQVHAATTPQQQFVDDLNAVLIKHGYQLPATVPNPDPTPDPVPANKPSDITGKLWTVMFPFNKVGATNSPENLYVAKAETDSRTKPYLFLRDGGVVFHTNAGGVHSEHSDYPRTELREMKDEAWTEGKWSNKTGSHTLEGEYSITHNLVKRKQIVFAQAHDSDDDIFEFALDGSKLVVFYNDKSSVITLESNYVLGTKFTIKAVAANSKFDVYYNGSLKGSVPKATSSGYWKTGSYLQTNPSKWGEAADAWGEVSIYKVKAS